MEPIKAPFSGTASVYKSINLVPSHVPVLLSKNSRGVDGFHEKSGAASIDAFGPQKSSLPLPQSFGRKSECETAEESTSLHGGGLATGQRPNVLWRSIPLEHLRQHPLYQRLPDPESITVSRLQDLSLYAQDSWQWDALHQVSSSVVYRVVE